MITIFTPTYNRAYIIGKLYESLCLQSWTDFEWVVVDDGSTDNTRDLIHSFILEEKIRLRYFYQENAGKHIAINKGVKEAQGELFFIVDSDDHLTRDAGEKLNYYYQQIKHDDRFAGVSGVRITPEGKRMGGEVDYSILDCNMWDFTYISGYKGDMAEAIKTSILSQYLFPVIKNEKFCTESLIWNRIGQRYFLRYTSEKIYVCEYLEDGLSANSIKARMKSPQYALLHYSELSHYCIPLIQKIKAYINFWRFYFCLKNFELHMIKMISFFGFFLMPIGAFFHFIDMIRTRK